MTTEHTYSQKLEAIVNRMKCELEKLIFNFKRLFNCVELWINHRLLMTTYNEKIKSAPSLQRKPEKLTAIIKQLFAFNYRKTKKHNSLITKIYNVSVHAVNNVVKSVGLFIEYSEKHVYHLVIYFKKSLNSVQHFTEIYKYFNMEPILIGCGRWCTTNSLENFKYECKSK